MAPTKNNRRIRRFIGGFRMTEKRFTWLKKDVYAPQIVITDSLTEKDLTPIDCYGLLNELAKENKRLKKELERCKEWINSDKYDYELTLAFIKNKGYSLKDMLEYEKEMKND